MNLKPTVILLLMSFSSVLGYAQISTGANLSAIIPVGEARDYIDNSYAPGIDILYKYNNKWDFGVGGAYFNTKVNYDGLDGNYVLSPWSISGYYNMGKHKWKPFIAAGVAAFWTEIHVDLRKTKITISTKDWFFGHSIKLGSSYLFNDNWSMKGFIDVGTFYLRNTYNIKFFKDAIIDDDLRNSVFPRSTTFASLNLGVYYTFKK